MDERTDDSRPIGEQQHSLANGSDRALNNSTVGLLVDDGSSWRSLGGGYRRATAVGLLEDGGSLDRQRRFLADGGIWPLEERRRPNGTCTIIEQRRLSAGGGGRPLFQRMKEDGSE